jgi:hypothetical protein
MSDFWKAFLKAPLAAKTAPFKKREGQPFMQGSARNLGHALLGDQNANNFEQKYLGDTPNGRRYPGGDTGPKPQPFSFGGSSGGGFDDLANIDPNAAAAAVPGTPAQSGGNPELDEMLRRLSLAMAQGGGSGGMMLQPKVGP